MIRETGLEAGDAIGSERSCFKASSGDHPKFTIALHQQVLYHPPAHVQVNFLFISTIFAKSRFPASTLLKSRRASEMIVVAVADGRSDFKVWLRETAIMELSPEDRN